MKVEVVYLAPGNCFVSALDLPDGASIGMAIEYSGVQRQFPQLDLATQKVGVFGKVKPLTALLADGDRVEIYRPASAAAAGAGKRKRAAGGDADGEAKAEGKGEANDEGNDKSAVAA